MKPTRTATEIDLSHLSRIVKLSKHYQLDETGLETVFGRVRRQWGLSEQDVRRIRHRPDRVSPAAFPPIADGEKRMQQLYDILSLLKLQLTSNRALTPQDRAHAAESVAQLGFSDQDLNRLISEIEKALGNRDARKGSEGND